MMTIVAKISMDARMSVALRSLLLALCGALSAMVAAPAAAQDRETPYWASLRASEINMRAGPSPDFPIEWVYRRPGLPVKVVRLHEGWRLVEDPDGARGWIVARLLDPARAAIVIGDEPAAIRADADGSAAIRWLAEPGVIGRLGNCKDGWCRFDAGGHQGWVRAEQLWGASAP